MEVSKQCEEMKCILIHYTLILSEIDMDYTTNSHRNKLTNFLIWVIN